MLARRAAVLLVAGGRQGVRLPLGGWSGWCRLRSDRTTRSSPVGSSRLVAPRSPDYAFARQGLRSPTSMSMSPSEPRPSLDIGRRPGQARSGRLFLSALLGQWRRQDRSPKPLRNLPPCRIENTSHNKGRQIGSRRAADHLFRSTCPKWRGTFWMTDGRSVRR